MNRLREYGGDDDDDDGDDDEQRHVVLQPCTVCGRRFLPAVLERHAVTCQRNANKKNKLFDSARQRRAGTELAAYPSPSMSPPPLPKSAVKKATKVAAKNPAQRPAAVKATTSDRIVKRETWAKQAVVIETNACPYCSRTFGAKSYDRHVEYCREKTQRIRTAPPVSLVALQRLEARTKYRPPPPPTVSKPTAAAAAAAKAVFVKPTTNRLKAQSYGRMSATYQPQNQAAVKRTESERVASVPQNRPKIKSWVK